MADLGSMNGAAIELGVFGPKAQARHPDSDLTIGQLATLHEFGLGGQEPRPVISQWTDENENDIVRQLFGAVRFSMATRAPLSLTLDALGKTWVAGVQSFIRAGRVRPLNTASTVEWKGHDRPLDGRTGALADAVTYKVTLSGLAKARSALAAAAASDLLDSAVGVGGPSKRIRGRKS